MRCGVGNAAGIEELPSVFSTLIQYIIVGSTMVILPLQKIQLYSISRKRVKISKNRGVFVIKKEIGSRPIYECEKRIEHI